MPEIKSMADLTKVNVKKRSSQELSVAFLNAVLADGAVVAVSDIEAEAQRAGLIDRRQRIGQSKLFRGVRQALGVRTFQRDRRWHWQMPEPTSPPVASDDQAVEAVLSDVVPDLAAGRPPDRPGRAAEVSGAPSSVDAEPPHPIGDVVPLRDMAARTRDPVDRAAAVVLAWSKGLARLDRTRPPPGVPLCRWALFIDDCRRFLSSEAATRAAIFGWSSGDIFGCDARQPLAQSGNLGLLWFCLGGQVTELHRDGAMISAGTSERFHQRRRADPSAVRLPWG